VLTGKALDRGRRLIHTCRTRAGAQRPAFAWPQVSVEPGRASLCGEAEHVSRRRSLWPSGDTRSGDCPRRRLGRIDRPAPGASPTMALAGALALKEEACNWRQSHVLRPAMPEPHDLGHRLVAKAQAGAGPAPRSKRSSARTTAAGRKEPWRAARRCCCLTPQAATAKS
jgi:hypothetical protein